MKSEPMDTDNYDAEIYDEENDELDPDNYVMPNMLPRPRHANYSVLQIFDMIKDGSIDLEPDYQRDVVWSQEKQSALIDSILRNYYIPPIILSTHEGTKRRCIDGKQRLTSIKLFLSGKIPFKDPHTGAKFWYHVSEGASKRRLLPLRYRTEFRARQIQSAEYENMTDSQEREVFQRVQRGMALTPAEVMRAIDTKRSRFVQEMVRDFITNRKDGIREMPWDRKRANDFRGIATGIYFLQRPLESIKGPPGVLQMTEWLSEDVDPAPEERQRVEDVLKVFTNIVNSPYGRVFRQHAKKMSPVEFMFVMVLVGNFHPRRDIPELARLIEGMRLYVRKKHADIRSNQAVTRTLVKYLTRKLENQDGEDEVMSPIPEPTTPVKGKRRLEEEPEEEGDDEEMSRPSPSPKKMRTELATEPTEGRQNMKERQAHFVASKNPYKFGPASHGL